MLDIKGNRFISQTDIVYGYSANLLGKDLLDLCQKVADNLTQSIGGRRDGARSVSATARPSTQTHPAEPEMVFVKGGSFLMGCTSEQGTCESDESPNHYVTVSDFYIGKYEITQGSGRN